jgi:hypothetical protein
VTLARLAFVAFVAFGLASAGLAACSGLDPTPPDPHLVDEPLLRSLDAGHDAAEDAP